MSPSDAPERDPRTDPRAPTLLRIASLLAIGLVFVLYRPNAEPELTNTLLLPLLGALAVFYLTNSVLVVALGACALAAAHARFDSPDLLTGTIYPTVTAVTALWAAAILGRRFRRAMHDRREQRRAERDAQSDANGPPAP